MYKSIFISLFLASSLCSSYAQKTGRADLICGKWISADNKLVVQVYKSNNEYRGKLVWFDDPEEDRDINLYYDTQNPNPELRDRKLVGMNVLDNLKFNPENGTWEDGTIYDASSGREYSSAISLNDDKTMKVTGYWKFKFIGRSMVFKKLDPGLASR